MKKIPDRWLYLPIIILGINFIYRLIDQSQLLYYFPLDYTNDISSYMAQLFFLDKCGFHNFCPYWYNGFIAFQFTPPAWFFFTLPLYWLFGDVKVATYVSMILIFILGLIAFIVLGKLFKFSLTKRIAFFLFFFGNAIATGNFIRLGDVHQLFGWLNLIIVSFIALYYKDKEIDWRFYWIILFLSVVILSHQTVAVLAFFVLFGLFLIKTNKEKIKIIISCLASLFVTSFWWVSYVQGFWKTTGARHVLTKSLISFNKADIPQNIAAIIIPIIFGVIFYYYILSYKKRKRELLFFLPISFLGFILFFRIVYFIPLLRYIYPDVYLFLFLFFSTFMFLKLDISILKFKKIGLIVSTLLIIISLISVGFSTFYTPWFEIPSETGNKILKILENVDDKFLVLGDRPEEIYSETIYSYAPIYLNLSTSEGWYFIVDENYSELSDKTRKEYIRKGECQKAKESLTMMKTKYLINYDEGCEILNKCFSKVSEIENVCLYMVN